MSQENDREDLEAFHTVLADIIEEVLEGETGQNPYSAPLHQLEEEHREKASLYRLWGKEG